MGSHFAGPAGIAALDLTLQSVLLLGLLVLIRTFLSWSLVVEMEGRWPWQAQAEPGDRSGGPPVK